MSSVILTKGELNIVSVSSVEEVSEIAIRWNGVADMYVVLESNRIDEAMSKLKENDELKLKIDSEIRSVNGQKMFDLIKIGME